MSRNFREGSGRSATLNISTEATEQLVKFLYGFETDKTLSLPTVKELIVYAGVCGLKNLEEALEDNLKTLLTKENAFDLMKFSKEERSEGAFEVCLYYVLRSQNF